MKVENPNIKLTQLVFDECDQSEKDELLRGLLNASIEGLIARNLSEVRQTLLDWEYTLLWKKHFREGKNPNY